MWPCGLQMSVCTTQRVRVNRQILLADYAGGNGEGLWLSQSGYHNLKGSNCGKSGCLVTVEQKGSVMSES